MGTDDGDAKIDARVDGLFRRARLDSSPGESAGVAWDERAEAIVRAAQSAPQAGAGALDALLAAPELEHEPGEPDVGLASHGTNGTEAARRPPTHNGTQQMSDDSSSKPPPASRRPSLKELAESVKNRPSTPAPSSVRSAELPAPPSAPGSQRHSLKDTLVALDHQLPAPPSGRTEGARPSAPVSATSTPLSAGAAGLAPPSAPPASAPPASVPVVAKAPVAPPSNPSVPSTKPSAGVAPAAKKGGGAGMGIGIAVIGLAAAAAFGLWMKSKSAPPPAPTVAAVETAAPAPEPVKEAPKAAKPEEEKKPEGVLDLSQLDDASSAAPVGGPLPGGPLPHAAAASSAPAAVASGGPPAPTGPGEELGDAIKKRAGGGAGVGEDAEPAAAEGSKKNLPDVPPTGAVTSAVNAVKGSAKGCVAGADDSSTATITFSSSGAVQSVSVGGWASGKPAAGCIKSALQAAKVPAFARPSYSTSVTIRP